MLIAMCDAKERLSRMLGVDTIEDQIVNVRPGIDAVRITAEQAMREYGEMMLKSRTVYKAVFENKYTKTFFSGVPGLHEWAMLGKAWYHSIEENDDGSPTYDVVLFDAPATGHGLDMLRVPKVIVEVVPPGLLRRDAERAWTMFQDPEQSGVIVVTLPEDMPTNETLELDATLRSDLKLPVKLLVINGVIDELFSEAERSQLLQPHSLDRSKPGDAAIGAAIRRAIRENVQAESLSRLDAIDAPKLRLPFVYEDAAVPHVVANLSERFAHLE